MRSQEITGGAAGRVCCADRACKENCSAPAACTSPPSQTLHTPLSLRCTSRPVPSLGYAPIGQASTVHGRPLLLIPDPVRGFVCSLTHFTPKVGAALFFPPKKNTFRRDYKGKNINEGFKGEGVLDINIWEGRRQLSIQIDT